MGRAGRPVQWVVHACLPCSGRLQSDGGLGLTGGDGALAYASEYVAEVYYSLQLAKGIFVTADYQYLGNPAYNAVRGPAHVFAGRLLARF